jgi:hypothetical protein
MAPRLNRTGSKPNSSGPGAGDGLGDQGAIESLQMLGALLAASVGPGIALGMLSILIACQATTSRQTRTRSLADKESVENSNALPSVVSEKQLLPLIQGAVSRCRILATDIGNWNTFRFRPRLVRSSPSFGAPGWS